MRRFWKRPIFWVWFIIALWLAYVLSANLHQPVGITILPIFLYLIVPVATILFSGVILGCILTLAIQFTWRRRVAKRAVPSPTTPVSSSSTIA